MRIHLIKQMVVCDSIKKVGSENSTGKGANCKFNSVNCSVERLNGQSLGDVK